MEEEIISGIYAITHVASGRQYIGSAVHIKQRWQTHRKQLRANRHHSKYLQRVWNKYGSDAFCFEVLEYIPNKDELITREQWWIDERRASDKRFGFNVSPKAGSQLGYKFSPEVRRRISASRKGIMTEAMRAGNEGRRGKPWYPARRAAYEANKGKPPTPAQVAYWEGKRGAQLTDEHRAKVSASLKGKPASPSRQAYYDRQRGMTQPEQSLAAIREANQARTEIADTETVIALRTLQCPSFANASQAANVLAPLLPNCKWQALYMRLRSMRRRGLLDEHFCPL